MTLVHCDLTEGNIMNNEVKVFKWKYSQLPLNGHRVKVDTSLSWTCGVGPCRTSVIYFISLQGGHLSKADSRSWS